MVTRTEHAAARAFQNARFVKIVHAAAVVIAARLQDTDLLGGVQIALDAFGTAKGMLAVLRIKVTRCRQIKSVFIRCGGVSVVRQRHRRQHRQEHGDAQKERKRLFTQADTCRDIWDFTCRSSFSHIFSSLESISGCFRSNQTSCSSIFAKYRSLALCASPLSSANFISAMSNSRQPQCPGWVGKQIIFKYVSISGLWAISSSVSP